MLTLLLLQAVAGPPLTPGLRKRVPRPATACPVPGQGDEIVVCGTSTDHRMGTLPEQPPRRALADMTSFRLPGGGTGNVHTFQNQLPGASSQGAAVTLKMPFGRKAKPTEPRE